MLHLQPQSEIHKVREFLYENGFCVVEENMVEEDGKYYPMMKVVHGQESDSYTEEEYLYGKFLLKNAHPVLKDFLNRELVLKKEIVQNVKQKAGENAKKRIQTLEEEVLLIEQLILKYFAQ